MASRYHNQRTKNQNAKGDISMLLREHFGNIAVFRIARCQTCRVAPWSHQGGQSVLTTSKPHFKHILPQYALPTPEASRTASRSSDPGLWSDKPSSHSSPELPAPELPALALPSSAPAF